jgi:hypothetical protein
VKPVSAFTITISGSKFPAIGLTTDHGTGRIPEFFFLKIVGKEKKKIVSQLILHTVESTLAKALGERRSDPKGFTLGPPKPIS